MGGVRRETLSAYTHQDVPFEKVVDALGPERDSSHSPVFQVMLAVQNAPVTRVERQDFVLEPIGTADEVSKFDLTFAFSETARGWLGSIEYSSDLFDAATVERMGAHLVQLLTAALEAPDAAVRTLDLLEPAEAARMLERGRPQAGPIGPGLTRTNTLHQRVSFQAARTAQAVAVEDEAGSLSYGELEAFSNRVAHRLRRQGVRQGDLVALYAGRACSSIAAILGILLRPARRTCRSIRRRSPSGFIFQLADARPVAVITTLALREGLEQFAGYQLLLDDPELWFEPELVGRRRTR